MPRFQRAPLARTLGALSLTAAALLSASAYAAPEAPPSPAAPATEAEAYTIGLEAYVYFYPLLSMDITRRQATNVEAGKEVGRGPANMFSNIRAFPDADFRVVVRPNFDTLYSSGWLDLTREPMVVSNEATGRYFMLPMLDMWSNVFAAPGTRTVGNGAAAYTVVPPNWRGEIPAGTQRIDAPTPYVWVIGRTQTNGAADYAAVHKVQDGYKITPMSQWGKAAVAPAPFKADPSIEMKTPPKIQVDTMTADKYFTYGAELMTANPPQITDWSQLARLRRIGIEPGKPFDFGKLDPAIRSALERAVADGQKWMLSKAPSLARVTNGWQMNTDTMGVYGNFYLKRAIVAQLGLGANQPEDAIYPMCVADADGKPVVGEANYVIRFEKSMTPPNTAFWSITMYDAQGFQVANPINRFAIGDRDALKFNADGSLEIYIQHENPGKDKESNWLPSPKSGELGVTMRIYAPKAEALDGRWNPPPLRKTN